MVTPTPKPTVLSSSEIKAELERIWAQRSVQQSHHRAVWKPSRSGGFLVSKRGKPVPQKRSKPKW